MGKRRRKTPVSKRKANQASRIQKDGRQSAQPATERSLEEKPDLWTRAPLLLLSVITLALLAPFSGKAFNIDDPLFIWAAKQIQKQPLDPYGFNVIWYFNEEPMSEVTKNPPLASYYLALAARLFGWSEIALHLSFLIPAIAVIVGTYFLARQFCRLPVWASLAALVTPVFLVSGTTVMCDTLMLAFWIWAIYCWVRGIDRNERSMLILSCFLIAAAAMTKYFAISLIPLLSLYTLVKKREPGWWALYFMIPVAFLVWYELATKSLYGQGLLLDSVSYASYIRNRENISLVAKSLTGLAFTGGCLAPVLFFSPRLWSRKVLPVAPVLGVILVIFILASGSIGSFSLEDKGGIGFLVAVECSILALGGAGLLALAVADLMRSKDAASALFFPWIAGTFVFATYVNWSVNGRSILPMVPAVGILILRQIEHREGIKIRIGQLRNKLVWALAPAALMGVLVTWSDYRIANSARTAAHIIQQKYGGKGGQIWFQGHWGFQYYMEGSGGRAIDVKRTIVSPGDIIVAPMYNTNPFPLPPEQNRFLERIELLSGRWIATHSPPMGASFYSDFLGPLPFAVGPVPTEKYDIFEFIR